MKNTGTTLDNNQIVEMTRAEWRTFVKLADAVQGKSNNWEMNDDRGIATADLSNVFDAIRVFTALHYRVNDLNVLIDDIRGVLSGKTAK